MLDEITICDYAGAAFSRLSKDFVLEGLIMSSMRISLAYRYVAIFMMLWEVNHCACELKLSVCQPISQRELKFQFVGTPRLTDEQGAVDTKEYSFGFSRSGILHYVMRLHPFGNEPLFQLHFRQAQLRSLVDTNQALEVARGWLTAMEVSVEDLENQNKPTVEQRFFYPEATPTGSVSNLQKVLLPIFDVTWACEGCRVPSVKVSIYGPTRELLELRQEDDSFSRRPEHPVRDIEGLMAIPDAEFVKYSESQLEELLVRHANTNFDISQFLVSPSGVHTNMLMQFPLQVPRTNPRSRVPNQ